MKKNIFIPKNTIALIWWLAIGIAPVTLTGQQQSISNVHQVLFPQPVINATNPKPQTSGGNLSLQRTPQSPSCTYFGPDPSLSPGGSCGSPYEVLNNGLTYQSITLSFSYTPEWIYLSQEPSNDNTCLYTNFCYNANCGSNWLTSPTIIGNLEAGVIYAWNTQASSDCSVPCTNSAYTDDQFFEIQPLITASGNTTVCAPNCVQLSLHQPSSLGTCPVCNGFTQTYQWFLNGNPITGATGATYCANTTGTNLYTAEITWTGDYISGCGSSLTTYPSNVISVTINTAPTSVSATATPNPVCEGQTLYLYGYGGTGATSWSWTGPSFSGGGQNQSLTATLSNAGTYTCTATNACGSASVPTSYVTVNPLPSITGYTITPNPICVGQTLSLSGTGNNVTSWSWFAPGGWASTGQSTSLVNIQPYNSGTFTILANNSCGTFTLNPTVTVDNPSVTASVNQNVSCGGGNDGSATAFASGGAGPYTYSWSGGGNNATKTGLTAGTYTINVTDMTGCTCSYTVTITAPPVLTVNATVNTEVNCSGGSNGSATSSVSGGLSPYTYLWSNSATTSSISSLTAGAYTLNVTDNNSCTGTSSVTITAPPFLNVNATVNTSVSCNGGSNGSATSIISGGTS
ncbi:MAG TPA: hypothetical protein VK808_05760, partial [Bacteroidia bacterium]|nr:hypothetical protein [Bacteroidia bacterium]